MYLNQKYHSILLVVKVNDNVIPPTPPTDVPSLDFSKASNSQYVPVVF